MDLQQEDYAWEQLKARLVERAAQSETEPIKLPEIRARVPDDFYAPNLEGTGFPWLTVPKAGCGKIRVAFVGGEIVPLLFHYKGGAKWEMHPCIGVGCKRCPEGDRRKYGYGDVVSTLIIDGDPTKLVYCRFILTLTPAALDSLDGKDVKGKVYDLHRYVKKTRRGETDRHGKVIVQHVRDSVLFRLPRPCNVRSYLVNKLDLPCWPVYETEKPRTQFRVVG